MCSRFRMRSPRRSWPRSSRSCTLRRFSRTAQTARQHGRVGTRDASALAPLARDAPGQSGRGGFVGQGRHTRSDYGQALGVRAFNRVLGGHLGWRDMASVAPDAERDAIAAIRADGEDFGPTSRWGSFICSPGVSTTPWPTGAGAAPQSEFLRWPGLLRPHPLLLRALGGGRRGGTGRCA